MNDIMSGKIKLNRNPSYNISNSNVGGNNSFHSLNSNGNDTSPLAYFASAKNCINSIYTRFSLLQKEVLKFLNTTEFEKCNLFDPREVSVIQTYEEKCDGITKMISRDRMKVVFFGRTSNGKSTLINAMLREKILPTGIGHTTNCFLQVEGQESTCDPCIYIPGSDSPHDIKSLGSLGSALSDNRLDSDSLVRVLWPKERCRLLKEDVVFVDSPGIDVKSDLDAWIDQQCVDADVFVLVVNAESVLTRTEREFFNKVNERLSKPNIFILNNRWDATAYEPEGSEEVKKQHIEIDKEFLCDELKVCSRQEATKRIFFVSAREALFKRTQMNPQLPPDHQSRYFEFENFEGEFEKCISMSAVKTKFEQPTQRGKHMISTIKEFLEKTHTKANETKENTELNLRSVETKLTNIEEQLQVFTKEIKNKIRNVMDEVEKKVSITLNDEIKRLYNIIDQYERPFHPDEHQLNWYKKELHTFVEIKLGTNLSTRLNTALTQSLEFTQKGIRDHVLQLIETEENRLKVNKTVSRADFSINYRLDCSNLCSDFKEDIRFKFSLGFTSLMARFMGRGQQQQQNSYMKPFMNIGNVDYKIDAIYENQQRQVTTNLNPFSSDNSQATNALLMLQGLQMIASKSNFMLLAVGGVVWRGLGWKILAVTGTLYGIVYAYERLMWTKKAQERLFKKQYAEYATSKLKLIVDLTSQNAAGQVQQELSMYFAQMCQYIDITRDDLYEELKKLENDKKLLSSIITQSKTLKNNGTLLYDEFENFNKQFLHHEHE